MAEFEVGYAADVLLRPGSIAVIGVSDKKEKIKVTGGTAVLYNLIRYGYNGKIYPVNPKYKEVLGIRCYPSVKAVPYPPDLAVISVSAAEIPGLLVECAETGCRTAVIISSGFSEIGTPAGEKLQGEIVRICRTYGIRVLGPNNLGAYDIRNKIVASTSTALFYYDTLLEGGIAWVAQSGALASTIHSRAADRNIGILCVVTSGNECDLQTADFIWHLAEDDNVDVIGLYLEGIRDHKKFADAAAKARRFKKPVLVYKAGRTETGAAAVKAHTGSIAGDYVRSLQFLKENGVIPTDSVDELYESAYLLERWKKWPHIRKYAVIAISGGEGAIISDGIISAGLEVPEFTPELNQKIMDIIPYFGSARNPVDVTAHMMRNPEKLKDVAGILEESDEVEALIFSLTTVAKEWDMKVAEDIAGVIRTSKKPGLVCWYSSTLNDSAVRYLREQKIIVFTDNDALFRALTRRKEFFEEVL